ncbi:MAG: thioredoxin family protein [Rikenellaceae bacterium]|nr:thioredoxin family protein [Rikenellaceae bacterium]
MEAEYEENDQIVFLGVSTDRTRDKEKWEKFLVDEQMPSIQLFAGDAAQEQLLKPYHITGIPRFILVGKDGNLIYADAPRPSSPEIRTVLNHALQ